MYPYELIFGITLYEVSILIGLIIGSIVFYQLLKTQSIPKKVLNTYFGVILIAVAFGFIFAVLVQSFWDYLKSGTFRLSGATYLGGFIGGSIVFGVLYKIKETNDLKAYRAKVINDFIPSLLISHFFGRIGCFLEGCCYGKETTFFLAVKFPHLDHPVHPTQLYEACVLLILFICSLIIYRRQKNNLVLYLFGYGISRFIFEFLRGDDRGQFILSLSSSQILSMILIIWGIYLVIKQNILKTFTL